MRLVPLALASLALLVSATAHAGIFVGNPPQITLSVDRPEHDFVHAMADLNLVRLHACAGGTRDFQVFSTIDLVGGHTVAVATGNWCGATLFWGTDIFLDGGSGSSSYGVRYEPGSTYVSLSAQSQWVNLAPFVVDFGSYSGNNPRLWVTIP